VDLSRFIVVAAVVDVTAGAVGVGALVTVRSIVVEPPTSRICHHTNARRAVLLQTPNRRAPRHETRPPVLPAPGGNTPANDWRLTSVLAHRQTASTR